MRNLAKKWIEPPAYAASREEYSREGIVEDRLPDTSSTARALEVIDALERLSRRAKQKAEKATTGQTMRKHLATHQLFDRAVHYLRVHYKPWIRDDS